MGSRNRDCRCMLPQMQLQCNTGLAFWIAGLSFGSPLEMVTLQYKLNLKLHPIGMLTEVTTAAVVTIEF